MLPEGRVARTLAIGVLAYLGVGSALAAVMFVGTLIQLNWSSGSSDIVAEVLVDVLLLVLAAIPSISRAFMWLPDLVVWASNPHHGSLGEWLVPDFKLFITL